MQAVVSPVSNQILFSVCHSAPIPTYMARHPIGSLGYGFCRLPRLTRSMPGQTWQRHALTVGPALTNEVVSLSYYLGNPEAIT